MLNINIPEVCRIRDNNFVTVPSKAWNALCTSIDEIVNVVNFQSSVIGDLSKELKNYETSSEQEIKDCRENISKIAKILEEIYETIQ